MTKESSQPTPLTTKVPLTSDAREDFIEQLFTNELPHTGELFIPDDSFYKSGGGPRQAHHMVRSLCCWLGIKPGYIELELEALTSTPTDGSHYRVYIESQILQDEFLLGGFLAYALTCYLIEQRKQVYLPDTDQQAILLATASTIFGLSAVIMNGTSPSYGLLNRFHKQTQLLRGFPLQNYTHMMRTYMHRNRIDATSFNSFLSPWARKCLGLKKPKQQSLAVTDTKHRIRVANSKVYGIAWLLVLLVGVSGFAYFQRAKPLPKELPGAQEKSRLYAELTRLCKERLTYDSQYADLSDIQTQRALNAQALGCQSLQNQYNAAEQRLQQLSPYN